jgi:hypothetical protein
MGRDLALNLPDEMRTVIEPLVECHEPLLIGVRHHSAALARAIPQLLNAFRPATLLLELPSDLSDWIACLADPQTIAPVALSAVGGDGQLFFYPLADFSPELVAVRWAAEHDVPLVACDLAAAVKHAAGGQRPETDDEAAEPATPADTTECAGHQAVAGLFAQLLRRTHSSDSGQLWERLVETPAVAQPAEAVRRAALLFGWAVRSAEQHHDRHNALREAAMRQAVRQSPAHSAAVVGAFHAAALLPTAIAQLRQQDEQLLAALERSAELPAVSLVGYTFAQLDERSGYPAGIRDPVWHQQVVESDSIDDIDRLSVALVTDICRRLRTAGHTAGTPDATEIIRMMRDLTRLRGLPVAGRGELIESLQTCLLQGELYGRGRAVARAAEAVLVGQCAGRVAPSVPRCGLEVQLEELLAELNLPGPQTLGEEPREIRLDVLRNARDRARAVVLRMLSVARIPYATRVDVIEQGARENITERWTAQWQHGTPAMVASAARHGVTLAQVAEALARGTPRDVDSHDEPRPEAILERLRIASECGLHHLVDQTLRELDRAFVRTANISQLVSAASWIGRIAAGHVLGLPQEVALEYPPILRVYRLPDEAPPVERLLRPCLDRLEGLAGSDQREDVAGLVDLVYWFTGDLAAPQADAASPALRDASGDAPNQAPRSSVLRLGSERLRSWCLATVARGSDRMRGAAAGVLGVLGAWPAERVATLTSGWFDAATDAAGRRQLRLALAGLAQVLLPLACDDVAWFDGLEDRFRRTPDEPFLARLPALRGGFSELTPADRRRLLEVRLDQYDERGPTLTRRFGAAAGGESSAEDITWKLAAWRTADLAGRNAVEQLLPGFGKTALLCAGLPTPHPERPPGLHDPGDPRRAGQTCDDAPETTSAAALPPGSISLADRWRLVLAVTEADSPKAGAAATCLDQLYGFGKGEGAGDRLTGRRRSSPRGGTEAPEPTTIEWADDLERLFGSDVCQEVLGEAVGAGRAAAAELLDPEQVQPSVELLRQVLSLAGGLPEGRAEKLRRLARRITEQLAKQLAVRLQPALAGLSTPRPTRRRSRRLNLARTVRDNLARVYRRDDGRAALVAERLVFQSPAKRQMDWHLTFVVDVSGSMSTSVVYSALVAAILAELPALTVRFLAFSTELLDLSGQVADPLALLLQVQVGGGTHIGLGLRAARAGIKLPARSIIVLVSDFEEGVSVGEMLAEVRALVGAGVKCVGLAALDDAGTARFHQGYAQLAAAAGMPVAAVSPENLARWIGDVIRGDARSTVAAPSGPAGGPTR